MLKIYVENNTWMWRNMKFISSVDEDIPVNTRNKFRSHFQASMYYSVYYIKKIAPLPEKNCPQNSMKTQC